MKKIELTNKDLIPMMLILFGELAIISALGNLEPKRRYTKKWRELEDTLSPIVDDIHKVGKFLDYCFKTSSQIRENENMEAKTLIVQFLEVLEHIEDKEVKADIEKIFVGIQRRKNEKSN